MSAIVSKSSVYVRNVSETQEIDFTTLSLQEIVETSKYKNLLDKLKDINKTELHAHLGGAVPMDFIQKS